MTEPGSPSLDRVWDYTVDRLNRYTSVDGPRRLDVMGYASGAVSLIYTGAASPGLAGTLQPNASTGPFYRILPNWSGTGIVAETGTLNSVSKPLYLPPKPETLSYDLDGNLTGDGRFTYTYDGENRLIKVEMAVGIPSGPGMGIDGVWYYEYDYMGRRIRKLRRTIVIEEMMTSGGGEGGEGGGETQSLEGGGEMGEIAEELRFLYDGWLLTEELSGTNAVVRTYVHGPDLSSSLGGAGGIGGLAFQVNAATASNTNTRWFTFDPQGNVTDLREVAANTRWASVEYGPFGEPTTSYGNTDQLKLRFSGKYFDEETGFNYFGYRYYNASTGRWINRDPAAESGGVNLYRFINNNATTYTDALGLEPDLWTLSGIGNHKDDGFHDYVGEELAKWGYESTYSFRSELGVGDFYKLHHFPKINGHSEPFWDSNVKSVLGEKKLDAEAEYEADGFEAGSCCTPATKRRYRAILVAPKTNTAPSFSRSCCEIDFTVVYSPYDGVPNQMLGNPGGPNDALFWKQMFGPESVIVVDNRAAARSDPDARAADYPEHVFTTFLDLDVIPPVDRIGGNPVFPGVRTLVQQAMSNKKYDVVAVAHSQGTNVLLHILNRICSPSMPKTQTPRKRSGPRQRKYINASIS